MTKPEDEARAGIKSLWIFRRLKGYLFCSYVDV